MTRRLPATVLLLALVGGCGEASGYVSGAAEEPGPSAVSSSPAESRPRMVTGYYLGEGPRGVVLFREDRPAYEPDHGPAESVGVLSAQPIDPDYRTYWPPGAFRGAGSDSGVIDLYLADDSLEDRPASMSPAEAELSIQQVVYTLQAYAGRPMPVRFVLADQPVDRLLGVPVAEPVSAAPVLETLSTMSLTTPTEGQEVSGSFRASGLNNAFEATAAWQIWRGDELVLQGSTLAAGAYEDRLFPWHDRIDVSTLAPGTYTFLARNDDPTDDGIGTATDTRTIVVR